MKTRASVCFLSVVATALFPVSAAQNASEWDEIRDAIAVRRSAWGRFDADISLVRVMSAELMGNVPTTVPEFTDGMVIVHGESTCTVDLHAGRFLRSDRTPIFTEAQDAFVTRTTVTAYDGSKAFTWYPDHETCTFQGTGPYDLTRERLSSSNISQFLRGPLFWSFGVFDPSDFLQGKVTNLSAMGFRFTRHGDLVEATGRIGRERVELTFDMQRHASVVAARYYQIAQNGDRPRLSASYQVQPLQVDGEWFAGEWQRTLPAGVDETVTVSRIRPSTAEEITAFQVPAGYLQKGMAVSDAVERTRYVLGADGSHEPVVFGIPVETRLPGRLRWLYGCMAVCFIAAVIAVLRKAMAR